MDANRGNWLGLHADDSRLVLRALGALLLTGATVLLLGTAVVDIRAANETGLMAVGIIGLLAGTGALVLATHVRPWGAHVVMALGTGLICLGTYFAAATTGTYAVMLVWMVATAASLFSPRALALHVAWMLLASAIVLRAVHSSIDVAAFPRWFFGSLMLVVAAVVMAHTVAGRRAIEAQLRHEIDERSRLQSELEHLALHDPLTAVANRRRLETELARELQRAARRSIPLAVVTLDLDEFKEYKTPTATPPATSC